jgi:arsenate reductase-like glutaredoxin family protein
MLQIIGTKKCKETAKALRACKERSLPYQFVNLAERSLSDGEWNSLFQSITDEDLLDTCCAYYAKEGYQYREFSIQEELKEHPELLKTPILRTKGRAHAGFDLGKILEWGRS